MAENDQREGSSGLGFDPSVQSEKLAFDPDKLVQCDKCERDNPPNRLGCLYCGSMLEIELNEAVDVDTGFKKPDLWHRGYNLVTVPTSERNTADLTRAAKALSLTESELAAILDASLPLPLCRVENEKEAAAIQKLLAGYGLDSRIISDEGLLGFGRPVRLGAVRFSDGNISLISFNSREETVVPLSEVSLLVEGVISISKVDQMEKRTIRGATRSSGEISTVSDESILDIYVSGDIRGYRIHPSGFDFSGLGDNKSLLAGENLRTLTEILSNGSEHSKLVTEYRSLRPVIGYVWDVETRRDTKGIQQTGFGKREQGSVMSTSNLDQFTRFSRLQRHFYEIEAA